MNYRRRFLVLFISLISVTAFFSCTSQKEIANQQKQVMDSWLNQPKSKLILSWGPPNRTLSDGNKGEVLIYESSRKIANVIYGTYMERTIVDYKEMYCDPNGNIYYWRMGRR